MYDDKRRTADILRGDKTDSQQIFRMLEEIRAEVVCIRKMLKEEKE